MLFQRLKALSVLALLAIPSAYAITLEDYMSEVKSKNEGILGIKASADAKSLRYDEGTLFFKPSFFLTGEYSDDQRPTNAPTFQGTQTLRHTLRSGLSQNLRTGTKLAISYNMYKTQINGVSPQLIPNKKFFDVAPQLEFTQSLWRNFLGSEFESTEKAQNAQVEAQKFTDLYNYKQLLINAENAYWRLYVAQTSLRVQEESLERAKRLRDWNSTRFKNNLTDESDVVQAESNVQSREIEYQDTLTEIQAALRDFNSLREVEGESVDLEGTKGKDSSYILEATLPAKMKLREDVSAYLANQKLATANAELGIQRNRPNLELYGTYSMNGRDKQYHEAYDMAVTNTRPYSIVGVRFTTPLDIGSLNDYKKSYAQEKTASELQFKRKSYEVEREWETLNERFENYKKRLKLAQRMVVVQDRKLTTEKRRYSQGRTTTFQVLQFEQDFANAQLQKLRYERELILVYNQLKLFSGVDHDQQ
jgi:outer membrane protein TolC